MPSRKPRNPHQAALRKLALSYPEAVEDFPWGEPVIKVRGKVFLFLGAPDGGVGLSVKLPETSAFALMLPFAEPTGYNLGKSGWVSASFEEGEEPPMKILAAWIDESYRAVAPKRLVASLPPRGGQGAPAERPPEGPATKVRPKSPAKRPARKSAGSRSKR